MKCREIKNKLSLYLDDLLDPEESVEIREHIDSCDSCSRELHKIQQIKNTLRSIEPVRAPENFLQSINERIDEESRISSFQAVFKKLIDLLTMRHAIEAAGVFAVTTVIVLIFSPLVKNTLPSIETSEEKSPAAYQKRSGSKQLKARKHPAPVPMDKMKDMENTARLKDSSIGSNKTAPVIVSFAMNERDKKNYSSDEKTADEAFEEIRSEKKITRSTARRASKRRVSKKSKRYISKETASGSGNMSKSDSFKIAPPAKNEKNAKIDTVSRIKEIARKFDSVVKKPENTKRLEVTIQGSKLKAFLSELEKIGSVRVIQKNFDDRPGLIQLYINYE